MLSSTVPAIARARTGAEPSEAMHHRPDLTLARLAGVPSAIRRQFRRGDFLVEAGCSADVMYLIRTGHVRMFLLDEDGRETTTAILGPGQVVGLASLLGHAVHRDFAQGLNAIDAWALPLRSLRNRLEDDASLLGLVFGSLARQFTLALGLYRDVALLPVAERARDVQMHLFACLGGNPPTLNRTTLAGLIQARPETLARAQARPAVRPTRPVSAEDAVGRASSNSTGRAFRRGDVVLGDLPAGQVCRVLAGQVQLSLACPSGRTIIVDTVEAGDLCGIGALLGLPPVGLHGVGLSDGAVEVPPASELLERVADNPRLLRQLIARLGERLERLEQRLECSTGVASSQNLINLLRELTPMDGQSGSSGGRVLPAVWSHASLARNMGVCRETVTRALAELEEAGAIRREGRQILVLPQDHTTDPPPAMTDMATSPPEPLHAGEPSAPFRVATSTATEGTHAARARGQIHRLSRDRLVAANDKVTAAASHQGGQARRHPRCRLCGLRVEPSVVVCAGCAERLELEIDMDQQSRCPACGRHKELCRVVPCGAARQPRPSRRERTRIAWLRLDMIDEPPAGQNSRSVYQESLIAQLADSIREYGLLQPVCVRPNASRYQLVFGARRLRAAARAGLKEVPCTVQVADDDHAFLLNTLENLHRRQLTGAERVKAIERLAATGLGVREISRRTGFNPSTISRWLRIDGRPELKAALMAGALDICRAKILVEAPRPMLTHLIEDAPSLSPDDLRTRIASLKLGRGTPAADTEEIRLLRQALRCLRAVRSGSRHDLVEHIRREVLRLVGTSVVCSDQRSATA
jgi:ParB/RepB/Spo0J family partition protein